MHWLRKSYPVTSWVWPEPWVPGKWGRLKESCPHPFWVPGTSLGWRISPRPGSTQAQPPRSPVTVPDTTCPNPRSLLSSNRLAGLSCTRWSMGTKRLLSKLWLSICSSPRPYTWVPSQPEPADGPPRLPEDPSRSRLASRWPWPQPRLSAHVSTLSLSSLSTLLLKENHFCPDSWPCRSYGHRVEGEQNLSFLASGWL